MQVHAAWRGLMGAALLAAVTAAPFSGGPHLISAGTDAVDVCSLSAARTDTPFATSPNYSGIRTRLTNPANFGPGAPARWPVTVHPGVAQVSPIALDGCDVFFTSRGTAPLQPEETAALLGAVDRGMVLIADGDAGPGGVMLQSLLTAMGDGRAASINPACTNSRTGAVLGTADNRAVNGPFGDIRGGTFSTTQSAILTPAGTDHMAARCNGSVVRFVVPNKARTPDSGLVMVGGDPSALNIFMDPPSSFINTNNATLYMNAVAAAIPPNRPPDCSGVTASPDIVGPPNGTWHAVTVSGGTDPDGDPVTHVVTGVTHDEGGSADSWSAGATPDSVWVQALRTGKGDGRTYEIAVTVDDGKGMSCTGTAHVFVPHDRRPLEPPGLVREG